MDLIVAQIEMAFATARPASLRDRHRSNPPQRSRSRPESGVRESAASASSPWEIPANSRRAARLLVYNTRHRTLFRGRTSRPVDRSEERRVGKGGQMREDTD